jgi:hypothetical protein
MAWVDRARVLIYKNSAWVDITDFVRFTRVPVSASTGRATEREAIGPGSLVIGVDNSGGEFTPGSSTASLELTLGMPIQLVEQIGYRLFPLWSGMLQLPETSEQLENVDNIVVVTAVDGKELLDNGRTFVSTLAEHIMATPTLVQYHPLNEDRAPFRDIVGDAIPLALKLDTSSLVLDGVRAPAYTPNGGPSAPGDDLRGVLFTPDQSTAGGFGFPTFASGYGLHGGGPASVSWTPGVKLTFVFWISITDSDDDHNVALFGIYDSVFSQQALITVRRIMAHTSFGALAGLLDVTITSLLGGTLDGGDASTILPFRNTGGSIIPIGVQLTYSPNTFRLWLGKDEFLSAAPTGTANNPQVLGTFDLGACGASYSHFQVHLGEFTHDDFLAQYAMGLNGLEGQRTDERVATILSYAGSPPADLDLGSTYMQATNLGGRKPGELIDEATTTEQGRFFFNGRGRAQFHSRVRVYNV